MAQKLETGQRVRWTAHGNVIFGIVKRVKRGGWYEIMATKEEGSPFFLGFVYSVQSRHVEAAP